MPSRLAEVIDPLRRTCATCRSFGVTAAKEFVCCDGRLIQTSRQRLPGSGDMVEVTMQLRIPDSGFSCAYWCPARADQK